MKVSYDILSSKIIIYCMFTKYNVDCSKLLLSLLFNSDFITYNVDTHEISFIFDGSKKDCDQGM